MNTGYVKMWRKATESPVFAHDGMWKLFCLCLMKATHQEYKLTIPGVLKPILLQPGQFVTGRDVLWEEYHQMHLKKRRPARKPVPTAYSLFRWLLTMQEMQILCIKSCNKFSIITICNWDQYQQDVQQVSNRRATGEHKQEHINTVKNPPPDISEKISELKSAYPDKKIIEQALHAIASTRKIGKIADTVKLSILKSWSRYPVETVLSGIESYLQKDHAGQGRREAYLLGIIRGQLQQPKAKQEHQSNRIVPQPSIGELFEN